MTFVAVSLTLVVVEVSIVRSGSGTSPDRTYSSEHATEVFQALNAQRALANSASDIAAAEIKAQISSQAIAHPSSAGSLWLGTASSCVRCAAGLALAAGAVAAADDDKNLVQDSENAFDALIRDHFSDQDGTVRPPESGESGPDIQTSLFAGELGQATLVMKPMLDTVHLRRYTQVVKEAADFLVRNGNLAWYTNGNIALANAAVMAAASRLTGDPKYAADYRKAWDFALNPPSTRWPKLGLVVTKPPRLADGSDGAGYLTEQGTGGVGYDPEYTVIQLDTAIRIYEINGDSQALRLANLLVNQIMPRVRTSDWTLDTSGGSRHPQHGRRVALRTGSFLILAEHGRTDLAGLVLRQITATAASLHDEQKAPAPGTQYAYGLDLAQDVAY
jgi:hypothetical protein